MNKTEIDENKELDQTNRFLMREIQYLQEKNIKLEQELKHYKSIIGELQSEIVVLNHRKGSV